MVGLVLAELLAGFLALRLITRHQARKFHLQQFLAPASSGVRGFDNLGYSHDTTEVKKMTD